MNNDRFSRRRLVAAAGVSGAVLAGSISPLGGMVRPAQAQDLGADATITANSVRLRSDPGLNGSVVAILNNGEAVRRGDDTFPVDGYNWASVTVKRSGQSGYVATDFLSTDGGGGASDFPVGSQFVVDTVSGGAANLRSAPGLSAAVVRSVATGLVGVIRSRATSANGYRWFKVEIDGSGGFLADLVIAPYAGGGENPGPGYDGYPTGSDIVVIDGPLNLREDPIDGAVLAVYGTGATGTTIDEAQPAATRDGYAWYPVEMSDGNVGWFAADFINLLGGGGQSGEVQVVDGPLNVRSTPGGAIVGTVPTGKYGALTGEPSQAANGYLWVNVRFYGGPSGWVADAFVIY